MSFYFKTSRLLVSRCNSIALQVPKNVRNIKRWVAPTLRELNKRSKNVSSNEEIQKRSTFIEWNYNSEVFAFGKRLQENFNLVTLQRAFVHSSFITQEENRQKQLGIENPEIMLQDNDSLITAGQRLLFDYVTAFLEHSLPKVPDEGIRAFTTYLTSISNLAVISKNLGTFDLILSDNIDDLTLANTLLALIGALHESSGDEKTYLFVRDFICTQLNQKDLYEIWEISSPFESLRSYCLQNKLAVPECRIIGETAKNTVLSAFHVGIYSKKILIGQGFGEDVETAIQTASIKALRKFYGISDNMRPFDFRIKLENKYSEKVKLNG
ncbi:MRPL44 family protein [Megaselia abdita]